MTKKQPKVSIGIPTYNRPEGLRRTLECITKQTYRNLEIIVSDNCSPDPKVKDVAQKFQKKDKRIQYFRQSKNIFGDNGEFVLEKSTGEYFMWAADDDYWKPTYISSCLEAFELSRDIVLAGAICELIDPKTEKLMLTDEGFSTIGLNPSERFIRYKSTIHGGNHIGGIFYGVYKRSVLRRVMPTKKVIASDHLLLAKLCFQGEFVTVPRKLMVKSWGGISRSYKSMASALNISSPFLIKCPYFVREVLLQKIIFQTDKLILPEKIRLSLWSANNYGRRLFNKTLSRLGC